MSDIDNTNRSAGRNMKDPGRLVMGEGENLRIDRVFKIDEIDFLLRVSRDPDRFAAADTFGELAHNVRRFGGPNSAEPHSDRPDVVPVSVDSHEVFRCKLADAIEVSWIRLSQFESRK